jgi:hypothetical protein
VAWQRQPWLQADWEALPCSLYDQLVLQQLQVLLLLMKGGKLLLHLHSLQCRGIGKHQVVGHLQVPQGRMKHQVAVVRQGTRQLHKLWLLLLLLLLSCC